MRIREVLSRSFGRAAGWFRRRFVAPSVELSGRVVELTGFVVFTFGVWRVSATLGLLFLGAALFFGAEFATSKRGGHAGRGASR